jgi:hypothetical protein
MYKRLESQLYKTRKTLLQTCLDLDIAVESIDPELLLVQQCSHCSVWNYELIQDLDDNPICNYCRDLIGL